MLEPIRHVLLQKKIVLASGSPRRLEILKSIGLKFEVITSKFEENLDKSLFNHPSDYVKENARKKAEEVWRRLETEMPDSQPDIIIGADTVVTLDNEIIEKPKSVDDAAKMLNKLSGNDHTVFTGVALLTRNTESKDAPYSSNVFHESTVVSMSKLSNQVINAYIETKEPLDKAGAYAIQGLGATLIKKINGDFYNVVGLPLHRLCAELDARYRIS